MDITKVLSWIACIIALAVGIIMYCYPQLSPVWRSGWDNGFQAGRDSMLDELGWGYDTAPEDPFKEFAE